MLAGAVGEEGFRDPPPDTIVTGGSGWLGRSLVPALAERTGAVRCLVEVPWQGSELELLSPRVRAIYGDVRSPADLDRLFDGLGVADVVHAAAVIHPARGAREFFDVNVGGTALMLDRARRAGIRRFVYVSSNSPFGESTDPEAVFDEDSPYRPTSAYGESKMEAELLVQRAASAGDLETAIVRCPWFYGPGQPPRQTRFMALVRRGMFPLVGDGLNRRSLGYTDNLVQGIIRAELNEAAAGRAYWLADELPYTMREIIQAVRDALAAEGLRVEQRQRRIPRVVGHLAGFADGMLQRSGRYSQEVHVLSEMHRTIACSVSRAKTELGYRPEVALAEGMRRSVRWCLENGEPL